MEAQVTRTFAKRDLKGLDPKGRRVLYGINPIREAFRAGREVEELFVLDGQKKLLKQLEHKGRAGTITYLKKHELHKVCGSTQHQGVVAKVEPLKNTSLKGLVKDHGSDLLVLMADGVQDPHNLGALLRVADGAGVDLVVVAAKGSASVQLGSVAKASAGASEHQAVLTVHDLATCLDELAGHGFQIVALEAEAGTALRDAELKYPLCLLVGGEDSGVKARYRQMATHEAHIPLRGKVNSLNVSVAGAVAVFEAAARRG
jgi:23S rRNA (guanosine2251-2'-O)-methyltransferase